MKFRIVYFVLFALLVFTGATIWEGSAAVAPDGELPEKGYYTATNSFPRNTIVDITNLDNGKSIRVIVASGLETTGLLAVISRDAANMIGLSSRSVGRIRINQPSDPVAFSRFSEGLASSGDPDYDPLGMNIDETVYLPPDPGRSGHSSPEIPRNLPVFNFTPESEWEDDTYSEIVDLPDYYDFPALAAEPIITEDKISSEPIIAEDRISAGPIIPEYKIAEDKIIERYEDTIIEKYEDTAPGITSNTVYEEPMEFYEIPATEEKYNYSLLLVEERPPYYEESPEKKLDESMFVESINNTELPVVTELPAIDELSIIAGISAATEIQELAEIPTSSSLSSSLSSSSLLEYLLPEMDDSPSFYAPVNESPFSVPVIAGLEQGKYYIQLGAYNRAELVETEINRIDRSYPMAVQMSENSEKSVYRILLGPLNSGESGAVLQRFRSIGYKDAFLRRN